jgi:serine/threonine protein kinase
MGLVFRATDLTLGRAVALKVIAPEAAGNLLFRARFERECRVARAIDHPTWSRSTTPASAKACCT